MDLKAEVRRIFEGLDLADAEIDFLPNRGTRVLVSLISPAFESMEDWERQELVWGALLDGLGDYESRWVEFVFTDTPGEVAEAIAQANAAPEV